MVDRNERHFLEFRTPGRRSRHRRLVQMEGHQQIYSFENGKENSIVDTPTGKDRKRIENGHPIQRRRLFTRSTSKKTTGNDFRTQNLPSFRFVNSSSNHAGAPYTVSAAALEAMDCSRSTQERDKPLRYNLSRSLFSNETLTTHTKKLSAEPKPDCVISRTEMPARKEYSPVAEYRSKESLLSNSRSRTSVFQSRHERSSCRTVTCFDNADVEFYSVHAMSSHAEKPTQPFSQCVGQEAATVGKDNIFQSAGTPSPTLKMLQPVVHRTPPPEQRLVSSPPGTSRLLRKYRLRIQRERQEYLSSSITLVDRNQITPQTTGKRGPRILDSGAQRCQNNFLSHGLGTPDTPHTKQKKENRYLLSPLTANRLTEDILSYRYAHRRAIENTSAMPITTTEGGACSLGETKKEFSGCQGPPFGNVNVQMKLPTTSALTETNVGIADYEIPLTVETANDTSCNKNHAKSEGISSIPYEGLPQDLGEGDDYEVTGISTDTSDSEVYLCTRIDAKNCDNSFAQTAIAITFDETHSTKNLSPKADLPLSYGPYTPRKTLLEKRDHEFQIESDEDTPSSKGSLQVMWDASNCGIGIGESDSMKSYVTSESNKTSRCSDCVNPMASTLMKMLAEEDRIVQGDQVKIEKKRCSTAPSKLFSSDLAIVYGLERVDNLQIARPKALLPPLPTSSPL